MTQTEAAAGDGAEGLVTVTVADQRLGVPLSRINHVFVPDRLSMVPLAPPEVAGLLNLRGRILTAIDLRTVLGLPARDTHDNTIALGVEKNGELFGLIADGAGQAVRDSASGIEPVPANLNSRCSSLCTGVCRQEGGLLMVLDTDKVLDLDHWHAANDDVSHLDEEG